MSKLLLFSFFALAMVGTVVSFAQNPPAQQAPKGNPGANPKAPAPQATQPQVPEQNPGGAPQMGEVQGQPGDSEMPVFQNAEGYHYDPTGRRDPFKPYGESQTVQAPDVTGSPEQPGLPPEPLQIFDVAQFKLLGIIWQVKDPKAMVLDPNGKTHLIRKQTKIGRNNGFVAAIREGEVIVVEPSVGENGVQTAVTRILNLTK